MRTIDTKRENCQYKTWKVTRECLETAYFYKDAQYYDECGTVKVNMQKWHVRSAVCKDGGQVNEKKRVGRKRLHMN